MVGKSVVFSYKKEVHITKMRWKVKKRKKKLNPDQISMKTEGTSLFNDNKSWRPSSLSNVEQSFSAQAYTHAHIHIYRAQHIHAQKKHSCHHDRLLRNLK